MMLIMFPCVSDDPPNVSRKKRSKSLSSATSRTALRERFPTAHVHSPSAMCRSDSLGDTDHVRWGRVTDTTGLALRLFAPKSNSQSLASHFICSSPSSMPTTDSATWITVVPPNSTAKENTFSCSSCLSSPPSLIAGAAIFLKMMARNWARCEGSGNERFRFGRVSFSAVERSAYTKLEESTACRDPETAGTTLYTPLSKYLSSSSMETPSNAYTVSNRFENPSAVLRMVTLSAARRRAWKGVATKEHASRRTLSDMASNSVAGVYCFGASPKYGLHDNAPKRAISPEPNENKKLSSGWWSYKRWY
eukprot:PhM_4_TR16178/c0_g1_i1/m.81513